MYTSSRIGIFKSILTNHINEPDRVIRYLKFTPHKHTKESLQTSSRVNDNAEILKYSHVITLSNIDDNYEIQMLHAK